MRRDLAPPGIAQLMRQRFRIGLHAGLRDIVGGIARRRGDALLGAGIDDQARTIPRDHVRSEGLTAVNDAPEIDAEQPLPIIAWAERRSRHLNAGIVHQHIAATEARLHIGGEPRHRADVTDIDRGRHHIVTSAARHAGDLAGRVRQAILAEIDNANTQAQPRKCRCCGKADARRTSRDDGNGTGGQSGVGHIVLQIEATPGNCV